VPVIAVAAIPRTVVHCDQVASDIKACGHPIHGTGQVRGGQVVQHLAQDDQIKAARRQPCRKSTPLDGNVGHPQDCPSGAIYRGLGEIEG
jgi:hypothetical protein